jgi:hypothetical protein
MDRVRSRVTDKRVLLLVKGGCQMVCVSVRGESWKELEL